MRKIIYAVFIIHLLFLAYLNNFYFAGIPVRSLLILLAGGMVVFYQPSLLAELRPVNMVYLFLALYGLVISVLNTVTVGSIASGELKLLQSYLVILSAYFVVRELGFRYLALAFLIITTPSAVVGILQGIDLHAAWNLQEVLMNLQNKVISEEIQSQITEALSRPPGLALYAIPQTYMLLTAMIFSAYLVLGRTTSMQAQLLLMVVNLLLLGGIAVSETRSAIGAALLILGLVYLYRFPRLTVILGLMAMVLGAVLWFIKSGQMLDSRLVSLEDESAQGRKTLYKFGIELFIQHPFGYGFNFDSVQYAQTYFINSEPFFHYDPDEKAHYIVPVHNSILNIVHTYGFAGLLVLFYYLSRLVDGFWYRYVFIGASLFNSAFHNAGIMTGDLFIDVAIGALLYESWLRRQLLAKPAVAYDRHLQQAALVS
ncbi:MAG: O-antigen ligase family protein [Thiothrix sp.]|nr:O-antigen ligase family protein [Thiothrix sp.]HPQ94911.1 O-antigen ligase family protein [Thiolinea sp.]